MELSKHYDTKKAEKKWQEYWINQGIFKFEPNSKKPIFSLDTPPPTVSGRMHLGHALAYAQVDYIMRYKRMRGYNIFYPFGFDDNGLATERYVEKKLGIKGNTMPRPEFVKTCLRETTDIEKVLYNDWRSIGISPDWSISYRTIEPWVQKVSQTSFVELYKMGREYRKESPTMWCPECQTAIAQVECEDKEFSTQFLDIVFKLEDGKELIIATTRPELLPACVGIFYHPTDKRYKHLKGKKAKVPLFDYYVPILEDERADPEKGTGIVMCCTFGDQTDMEWYFAHNLPLKIAITGSGLMNEEAGKYKGLKLKQAREKMIEDLKNNGLLKSQKDLQHEVNVHERCGTAIEFLVTKQWFIKYLDMKQDFLKAGSKMKWYPAHMRTRYDNWIKGLQWDWCISRQRFFGIPIPVWYCKNCDHEIVAEESWLPVDPTVDKPKIKKCPKCSSTEFIGEKDVLDTWATSSLTPMIATKWKKDQKFFKKMNPMSLRSNGHDIITFWLFNTVVKSLLHEKQAPWHEVMINGFVLDPKGKKMSKSKGNVINPQDVLEKYSSDCLRFWAAYTKLGEDIPYKEKELVAGTRLITKLWNAARFSFMHLKDYDEKKPKLELIDKWLLSKMQHLIKQCTEGFEIYDFSRTKNSVEKFFWHTFTDDYLEIVKDRLYNPDKRGSNARKSAQYTLYYALLTQIKLIAPIMPHITEELYQLYFKKTEKEKSMHLTSWPKYDKKLIDKKAEQAGDAAVEIIEAVRKYKSDNKLSMGAEIKELVLDSKQKKLLEPVLDDLKAVTRAQNISFGPKLEIKA